MVFNFLKSLLGETDAEPAPLEPALAAAALMYEVMWADHDISPAELEFVRNRLQQQFGIAATEVEAVLSQTEALHHKSVGLHDYTRAINAHFSESEKVELLEILWRIAGTDTRVDAFEEHVIRRVADLLYLSHKAFIASKLAARDAPPG